MIKKSTPKVFFEYFFTLGIGIVVAIYIHNFMIDNNIFNSLDWRSTNRITPEGIALGIGSFISGFMSGFIRKKPQLTWHGLTIGVSLSFLSSIFRAYIIYVLLSNLSLSSSSQSFDSIKYRIIFRAIWDSILLIISCGVMGYLGEVLSLKIKRR